MIQVCESKGAVSVARSRLIEPRKGLRCVGGTCAFAFGHHLVGGEAGAHPVKGLLAHRRKPELNASLSVEPVDRCRTSALRRGVVLLQSCFQQLQRGGFDALGPIASRSDAVKQSDIATVIPVLSPAGTPSTSVGWNASKPW